MTLAELATLPCVVVQCHDSPDPDTIACGFALFRFLVAHGVDTRLIYGGQDGLGKPNVRLMVRQLAIPLEHVKTLPKVPLIVTVDCQYGAGNVTRFECERFWVIDHHRQEVDTGEDAVIRPQLGSCATLVWDLMKEAGFDFGADPAVLTALYYGLYTDTNALSEMRHPLDRDLADEPGIDFALIKHLKNAALTLTELGIVAHTLEAPRLIGRCGLLQAPPCDPNLLGFASDIARQVERFDCCVVYAPHHNGYKLSIRSTVREIMANELAAFLTEGVGSGGGNLEKAGGNLLAPALADVPVDTFLATRIEAYQKRFAFIDADRHDIDFAASPVYRRRPLPIGFVRTLDLFPEKTPIRIRTLEGDIDTLASPNLYLLIGIELEMYPIERTRFEASYRPLHRPFSLHGEYAPTVIRRETGDKRSIASCVEACLPLAEVRVRAKPLTQDAKLFTRWDPEKYVSGKVGDYLVALADDVHDLFIVKRRIFEATYQEVEESEHPRHQQAASSTTACAAMASLRPR